MMQEKGHSCLYVLKHYRERSTLTHVIVSCFLLSPTLHLVSVIFQIVTNEHTRNEAKAIYYYSNIIL